MFIVKDVIIKLVEEEATLSLYFDKQTHISPVIYSYIFVNVVFVMPNTVILDA